MKILVIIVSYNFERWLDYCLTSIRRSLLHPDVLVVDNASKDETVSRIERDYPEVRLIKNAKNIGFGRANNIGMKLACENGYNAVYLLNQDAWIFPNTLSILSEQSKAHPSFGVLSPVHWDGTGKRLDKGFADYAKVKSETELMALVQYGSDIVKLPFVNAAHWYIPVRVLKKVGGFSPLFHLYGEDVDLVNRIKHFGYRIGYCPKAFAVHDRADRKAPSPKSTYRSHFVYLLSQYTNINLSLPEAFAYSVLASIKSMAISLRQANYNNAKMYAKICFHLLGKTLSVIKVRQTTAVKGQHFL